VTPPREDPVARIASEMEREVEARSRLVGALDARVVRSMAAAASAMIDCLRAGRVVYACGNGGSATQAAHFATELVGRFKMDRRALPVFSLGENTGLLTSLGNDYSFQDVFARQIAGIGRTGDCLLALSTSGTSPNIVRACEAAAANGVRVIAMTGAGGGDLARHAEVTIAVGVTDTPLVQELHLAILHMLCRAVEAALASPSRTP
jgi:phosphoheptose isomerase